MLGARGDAWCMALHAEGAEETFSALMVSPTVNHSSATCVPQVCHATASRVSWAAPQASFDHQDIEMRQRGNCAREEKGGHMCQ